MMIVHCRCYRRDWHRIWAKIDEMTHLIARGGGSRGARRVDQRCVPARARAGREGRWGRDDRFREFAHSPAEPAARTVEPLSGLAARSVERSELMRLRREDKQLRLERDILFRAAARSSRYLVWRWPGLRIHERDPSGLSDGDESTRARHLGVRLCCWASPVATCPRHRRRDVAVAGSNSPTAH